MDWISPYILLTALPLAILLAVLAARKSVEPISRGRRIAQAIVRCVLVGLVLLAIAGPALQIPSEDRSVIFVLDHSRSLGESGMKKAYTRANDMASNLPAGTRVGFVSAGEEPVVLQKPSESFTPVKPDRSLLEKSGNQTNLARAVAVARGLFPAGSARQLVLISDGVETRGDLLSAAREAAAAGTDLYAVPTSGELRKDVRIARLTPSRRRLHEGARLRLRADVQSSLEGTGKIKLYENGIQVASRKLELEPGTKKTVSFSRTPEKRNLYRYEVRLAGFKEDTLSENNRGMSLVEVRGKPLVLYVEGKKEQARHLAGAMKQEGIRLDVRPPGAIPESPQKLSAYDGVILSDVPAYDLSNRSMSAIKDYVEKLGGGLVVIGGDQSYGAGGYYRTPIEKILPVKMIPPDMEEKKSSALALVLDRSGSMSGHKIQIVRSAAVASVDMLQEKDFVGVVAFDSSASWIVPMTRASKKKKIKQQISTLNAGGGTNVYPGMTSAHEALKNVQAKVKHMIVLSDGQTQGSGYQALAGKINSDEITISTVAVGSGADMALLKSIASSGGGEFYKTMNPNNIPSIFTRDTMRHTKRLVREHTFQPRRVERHPMIKGISPEHIPQLLGYVRTDPRSTAQVPLVTDTGAPLLAFWRYGLGKVTAFTSGCKTRWAPLWLTEWKNGYGQFWSQVLRETIREPQGQLMDLRVRKEDQKAKLFVDVLKNPAEFEQQASVRGEVYFVPAHALGKTMQQIKDMELDQVGPGRYAGSFTPDKPGVYLIRARTGSRMISTGLVHRVSGESAIGNVNKTLLQRASAATGGKLLSSEDNNQLPARTSNQTIYQDLTPYILLLAVLVFLIDLVLRRWENVLGVVEGVQNVYQTIRGS